MLHQTQGRERVVLAVPFGCRFHLLLSRFQLPLPRLVRRHSAGLFGRMRDALDPLLREEL